MWTATARPNRLEDYIRHFTDRVLPELTGIPGYEGALLLERGHEIIVLTWWTSDEAIRRFAGSDINRAVIAEEARQMLQRCDETVGHYTVRVRDRA